MIDLEDDPSLTIDFGEVSFQCIDREAFLTFPVIEAKKLMPSWISNLNKNPSLKQCPGFISICTSGYILRAWSDFEIVVYPDGEVDYVGESPSILTKHDPEEYKGFLPNYTHVKILSPWVMKSKSNISYIALEPTWHYPYPTHKVVPGIATLGQFKQATNPQCFFEKKDRPYVVQFNKGVPLVHFIILKG